MEIRYDKAAVKFLQGLPQKLRESIREAIKGLTQKPPKGDIRPMQGYKDGRHRLRVGKHRVISQLIKRLVLEWDPDFTKLTPEERNRLEAAEQRIDSGEYVKDSEIEW